MIDTISVLFLLFSIVFAGCTKYQPSVIINFTENGENISIKKAAKGHSPSWSPDGEKLVYQNDGIWIMDINTNKKKRVIKRGKNPKCSPDGKMITYVHNGIWLWDKFSGAHTQINTHGDYPCWSPDGKSLVIKDDEIWQIGITEETKTKLLDFGIPMSFFPDGSFLLIETWEFEFILFNLELLNLSTSEPRRLVEGIKGSFAPDGKSIVYSKDGIWIFSMDNKESTRIVMEGYDPEWSPMGDKIAFCYKDYIWLIDSLYTEESTKIRFK